ERRKLHLDAALLLLVGEGLAHAVRRWIERVGKPDLVVLVIGRAEPEPHRVDTAGHWTVLAFGRHLGLARIDARVVVGAVDAGNTIERVVLSNGGADETLVEKIRGADRLSIAAGCR